MDDPEKSREDRLLELAHSWTFLDNLKNRTIYIGLGPIDRYVPHHKLKVAEPIDWSSSANRAINAVSIAKDLTGNLNPRDRITMDIHAGALYIVTSSLASFDEDHFEVHPDFNPVSAKDAENTVHKALEDKAAIDRGMALAYATKVSWFLTDHHVGQKYVTGCLQAVFRALYAIDGNDSEKIKQAVWRYAYLLDTKLALKALGFMKHEKDDPPASYPETISPQILPFLNRFPAGTAILGLAESAFDLLTENDMWEHYRNKESSDRITKLIADVKADKASYHIRADQSLGLEKKRLGLADTDKWEISAIILAIAPKSKLARSRYIVEFDYVVATETYHILRHAMKIAQVESK